MSFYKAGLGESVQKTLDQIRLFESSKNVEAANTLRERLELRGWIQVCCKYGYVLPDRCRYNSRTGCDCGAYPPIKN